MVKGSFNNRSSLDLVPEGVSPRRDRPLVWPLVVVFWLLMAGPAGALEFEVQQIRFGLEDISHPALKPRSEEHTSELQSRPHLVCRLLLEKKKNTDVRAGST